MSDRSLLQGAALAGALVACGYETLEPPVLDEPIADAGPDRVAPVGVPVKLDGRASEGAVSVEWSTGDGVTYADLSPTHIYRTPGNRTAILRITGADGSVRTDSARITVHERLSEVPPVTASTLHRGPDGRIWGFVRDADALFVTDGTVTSRLSACQGGEPAGITVIPAVSLLCDGDPAAEPPLPPRLIHFPNGSVPATVVPLPFGSRPSALVHRDGAWTVTLSGTGQRARITNLTDVALTDVGPDPRGLALIDAGPVTARFRSGPDVGELFTPAGPVALPYDPGPDTDTGSRGVPNLLVLAASPDGQRVFVGGTLSNTARGGFVDGQPLTFETTVRAFLSVVDVGSGDELLRRQFDDQGRVGAIAVSPLGNLVYVAFPGSHVVFAVDAYTGELAGSVLDAGRGIDGLALSADGGTLWVNATLEREIRAYDVRDLSVLAPLIYSAPTVDDDPLPPEILQGKRLFQESLDPRIAKDGYIACEVCHPDGDHDGQTWDFTDRGEGLRNTISLLGRAGVGMGPVHWTGNFDEIHDFEHDMRGPFRGTGLMTDADFALADSPLGPPKAGYSADLDALSAYVSSLDTSPSSPFPVPEGGVELFEASGCATCHPAPLYTDSALDVRHDVGTLTEASGQRLGAVLDGLDTPTLRGTWDSGPWLHDGSAATLRDAIAAHADAPTDEVSLDLLADFVRSL